MVGRGIRGIRGRVSSCDFQVNDFDSEAPRLLVGRFFVVGGAVYL